MATIQRPVAKGQSTWDYLARAAGARLSAFLTGQYTYSFSNTTGRTVKMHLSDDQAGKGAAQDYFLTVPAGAQNVEVPMKSDMIVVTAGFFRPEDGAYEIFWENRRFSWETGVSISAANRHSVDANRIRTDVWPGAPEAPRETTTVVARGRPQKSSSLLMLPPPVMPALAGQPKASRGMPALEDGKTTAAGDSIAAGFRVFSRRPGGGDSGAAGIGWVSCDVTRALEDGSLEVSDAGGSRFRLRPTEEASLIALPPGVTAASMATATMSAADSFVSDMAPPPAHLRHPRSKIEDAAGTVASSYASFSTAAPSPVAAPAGRR